MSVGAELKNAVISTEAESQYDEQAKRLLGHKSILARILIKTLDEFKGMKPDEAEACIEGDVLIGRVPAEPGMTNEQKQNQTPGTGELIRGFNTEQSEVHEGMVRFDIVFYVRTKDGLIQIIINVEIQAKEPDEYDIVNRAIFYVSRLISSQKGRDFVKSNYNDLRKVCSIWICLDMEECLLNHIHLTDDKLMGVHDWKGRLDLFNIVMIGLPRVLPECAPQYELHRLLTALLSMDLTADEKMRIISDEYDIGAESDVGKETQIMCNLSQGVLERGIERGIEQGIECGYDRARSNMILKLHERGDSVKDIAEVAEISPEEVELIIKQACVG